MIQTYLQNRNRLTGIENLWLSKGIAGWEVERWERNQEFGINVNTIMYKVG